MHTHTYKHVHVHTHVTRMHTFIHPHEHIRTCTNTHIRIHKHRRTYITHTRTHSFTSNAQTTSTNNTYERARSLASPKGWLVFAKRRQQTQKIFSGIGEGRAVARGSNHVKQWARHDLRHRRGHCLATSRGRLQHHHGSWQFAQESPAAWAMSWWNGRCQEQRQ
jgi:hypothetical protein